MKKVTWVDSDAMAREVFDGAIVVLSGSGGGLQEADHIAAALEGAVMDKWAGHQIGQVHFIRPKKSMSQIGG